MLDPRVSAGFSPGAESPTRVEDIDELVSAFFRFAIFPVQPLRAKAEIKVVVSGNVSQATTAPPAQLKSTSQIVRRRKTAATSTGN
jgi:hypothetical protein